MDSIKANLAIQYRLNNKIQTGDLNSESKSESPSDDAVKNSTGADKAKQPEQKQQTISTIALSTNGDPTKLAIKA